jgi:RNase P/RNase MRP subunit POP5
MANIKKRLNVIRPTLRHKKVYLKISFRKEILKEKIFFLFSKNYQNTYGLFYLINCNLTLIDFNSNKKEIILRINKDYFDSFLTSIFFLKKDLGAIFILKIKTTLKSIKTN